MSFHGISRFVITTIIHMLLIFIITTSYVSASNHNTSTSNSTITSQTNHPTSVELNPSSTNSPINTTNHIIVDTFDLQTMAPLAPIELTLQPTTDSPTLDDNWNFALADAIHKETPLTPQPTPTPTQAPSLSPTSAQNLPSPPTIQQNNRRITNSPTITPTAVPSLAPTSSPTQKNWMKDAKQTNIILTITSLVELITLFVVVGYRIIFQIKQKSSGFPIKVLCTMFVVIGVHIFREVLLLIYFEGYNSNHDFIKLVIFVTLLPVTVHFWIYSIVIYSWLNICYMMHKEKMKSFKRIFIIVNVIFSVVTISIALYISVVPPSATTSDVLEYSGITLSIAVAVISVVVLMVSMKVMKHISANSIAKKQAKYKTLILKLRLSSISVFFLFMTYAVVTLISEHDHLYLEYHPYFNFALTMSDVLSLCIIFYLYKGQDAAESRNLCVCGRKTLDKISSSFSKLSVQSRTCTSTEDIDYV
eukprot:1002577_1